jgi:hypothetical protein
MSTSLNLNELSCLPILYCNNGSRNITMYIRHIG